MNGCVNTLLYAVWMALGFYLAIDLAPERVVHQKAPAACTPVIDQRTLSRRVWV